MPDAPPKPRATSFFPLRKLKGNQPTPKMPTVHLAHLEEEDTGGDEDKESHDPSGIKGVTEEFMVHLARAVKDAQVVENAATIVAAQNTSSIIAHSSKL